MPMHDWTRVEPSIYHDFHQKWAVRIAEALDARLPPDYYAIAEGAAAGYVADVLALQRRRPAGGAAPVRAAPGAGPAVAAFVAEARSRRVPRKKTVVAIRHAADDRAVAFIELVSPGNKSSKEAFREFVGKSVDLLRRGVHLLLVDPFPPGPRDPGGIHPPIWRRLGGQPIALPADRPLTLASYESQPPETRAYIERLAVGDAVPDMPVFLEPGHHVAVPLRETYDAAFAAVPLRWREVIAPPPG